MKKIGPMTHPKYAIIRAGYPKMKAELMAAIRWNPTSHQASAETLSILTRKNNMMLIWKSVTLISHRCYTIQRKSEVIRSLQQTLAHAMDSLLATGNNKHSCRGGSRRRSHVAIFYIDSLVAWSSNWGNGISHWVPAAISDATRDFIEPLELQNAFGAHDDDGGSTKIHHQKIQTSLHKNSSVCKKRMKVQGQPALDWNESCFLSGVMNSRALVSG